MAVQLTTSRSLISKKLVGAFFAIFALFIQPLVALDVPSAFAVLDTQYYVSTTGNDTNCDGTADVADADTTTAACAKATVQAGINAAGSNATLNIADGTYNVSQYLVLAGHEGLTISGNGKTKTFLQLTATFDGFKVQANNVTLKDFTIDGNSVANYGLRAQGVDNLTVDNVKATNMKKTGFDINGVTNSSFTDLNATGNGGNGFSVTDVENVSFKDTISSGNAWGGMGIYTHGGAYPGRCGVDGITFSGTTNLHEAQALYTGIDSTTCTNIANLSIPTELAYKVTLNNSDPQDIYTASQTDAESLVSTYSALSPVVTDTQTGHYVVVSGQTIQSVVNAAPAGSVIDVPAGTYTENVNVNKAVTLVGAGSGGTGTIISGTSGVGLNLSAGTDASHRVEVKNLKVTGFTNGITASSFNTLENVVSSDNVNYGISLNTLNDLKIVNSKFNNNKIGLKLGSVASANNIQISGSEFNGNTTHGWYSDKNATSGSYITNLSVTDTSFSDNGQKGFYTEKLSDATFDHITVDNSGSVATYTYGSGFNVNLKYGNYENITVQNSTITNSGLGDAANGTGINIEARDDGSYASNPATLSNVKILGGQVTSNQVGLRFGETGKNNAGPTGVTISGVNLSGNINEAVNNQTTANIDATGNWWGSQSGPTASQYSGDVTSTPWCNVSDCSTVFSDQDVQLEATGGVATTDSGAPLTLSGSTVEGNATAVIPAGTTVTSSDSSWDGTIAPPTEDATYNVPGSSSMTSLVITVGSDTSSLTFDKGVRLVLPDQAGKHVGFIAPSSSTFTEITNVCSADDNTQPVSPANECKIDVGNDLVVWTKHFTTFATYTVDTAKPTGNFTAPVIGSTHKGLIDVSANVADSGTGLNNLQVVLRNSSNAVVGNWTYNVQSNTASKLSGTGTISFSGDSSSGTVTVQNVNTASLTTGKYNLRLFTSDVAGNGNSAIYGNFYVDNSAPDASIESYSSEQKGDTTVTVDFDEVGTAGLGQQQIVMRDGSGAVAGNWTYNVDTGATTTIAGPAANFAYTGDEQSGQLLITFDSSALTNGSYSLRAFTKDQLGNGRSNIYGSVTFDNQAPSVSFDNPAQGSTVRDLTISASLSGTGSNIKQYGFDVTGPGGLHFSTPNYHVDQSTVTISDLDLCAEQYYGQNCLTDLADGTYTVRAKVYDNAGNRNITTYLTLTVDRSAPDGSFDVSSSPVSGTTVIKVDIDDVGEAGLGVQQVVLRDSSGAVVGNWEYNVDTDAYRLINGNGTASYTGNEDSGTLEISFDTTGLNGDFSLRLFTKDQLGNGRSNIYGNLAIDNTTPTVSLNKPADGSTISGNKVKVRATANDANFDSCEVNVYIAGTTTSPVFTHICTQTASFTTETVAVLDTTNGDFADGQYDVVLTVTDQAGNTTSDTNRVTVDNTKPATLKITSPSNGDTVATGFTVKGTAHDVLSGIESVRYNVRKVSGIGGTTSGSAVIPWTSAIGTDAWTFDVSGLSDDYYRITVEATDAAGNSKTRHIDVKVDADAPVVTVNYSNDGHPTNQDVIVTLTTDEPVGTPTGWTYVSDTEFKKTYVTNDTETVTLVDAHGNATDTTIAVTGIDTVAPTQPIIQSATRTGVTGSAEANSTAIVYVNGLEVGSAAVDAQGAWTYTFNQALDSAQNFTITAKAMDAAGNVSVSSLSTKVSATFVKKDDTFKSTTKPISPLPTQPVLATSQIVPTSTNSSNNDGEVLGTKTEDTDTQGDKATTATIAPSEEGWKLWGVAWYWWLLILAVLGIGSWYAARWYRNREEEF